MYKFSASYLAKSSAAQLNHFFRKVGKGNFIVNPNPKINDNIIAGNKFAESHQKSKFIEMGGCFERNDIQIFFSIDEVRKRGNKLQLIEHKSVREDEGWYFHSCLTQTAFLGSLVKASIHFNKESNLKTSAFLSAENVWHLALSEPENISSKLNYGGTNYIVTYDAPSIMKFFMTKARQVSNYNKAKRFDQAYRSEDKEWNNYMKHFINFKKRA